VDGSGKPRQQSAEVLGNAEIKGLLEGIVQRIGDWQNEVVYLQAQAARATGSGRLKLSRRAEALLTEIGAAREFLVATLSQAPDRIAKHSRVEDVTRSLANLSQSVQQILDGPAD
jgi:hypothetical protein